MDVEGGETREEDDVGVGRGKSETGWLGWDWRREAEI